MAEVKILVVDDEADIREFINMYLKREGFEVIFAKSGIEALELVSNKNPNLIILDILLPDINGTEVCKKIRERSQAPIIFLSCKSEETDKILGLEIGGDDYITKPFSPRELVARVKAHLRRINLVNTSLTDSIITYENIMIDKTSHSVFIDGTPVSLSVKDFELLLFLAQNPNRVFSMEELYTNVWKENSLGDTRTVMVHISNIRKKIEKDPANPKYITTIRGVGYKFNYNQGWSKS